jgi:hypothetical protein
MVLESGLSHLGTCLPGHATVSTGAFPHLHGIMQNTWWIVAHAGPLPADDQTTTTLLPEWD